MFVEINNNKLNVEVMGPEDAPLLIVHHGAPGLGSLAEPRGSFGPLADSSRTEGLLRRPRLGTERGQRPSDP